MVRHTHVFLHDCSLVNSYTRSKIRKSKNYYNLTVHDVSFASLTSFHVRRNIIECKL